MNLCQKCDSEVRKSAFSPLDINSAMPSVVVPESKCEFWAHKELNDALPTYGEWQTGIPAVTSGQAIEVEWIDDKVGRWRFVYPPRKK